MSIWVPVSLLIIYLCMIWYHWAVYDPFRPNISENWYQWFRAVGALIILNFILFFIS